MRFAVLAVLALTASACAHANAPEAPKVSLQSETAAEPLDALVAKQPLTALLFFTAECPVQKAHDARFRELVAAYGSRVTFVAVQSETGADMPAERADASKRIAVPLLEDRGAVLADALGVEYSTHAVLLDRSRRVLYSGAFDADRTHLTDNAEPFLREAIDASLAGKAPAKTKTEALGCPLRKH